MANCCGSPNEMVTASANTCSRCGAKGARVEVTTVKALLTELALRHFEPASYYFCPDATCSIVYFAADGQVYTTTDVRVPVWQKQPAGARRICYCFDENEASMAREVDETGRCGAIQRVRDHIAAGRCACEVRNPRGTCCLGEVMEAVARVESRCFLEVEK
jgi:hypothetical protein